MVRRLFTANLEKAWLEEIIRSQNQRIDFFQLICCTETAHFFIENGKLYGRGGDDDIAELYPETETRFSGTSKEIGGFKLQFFKDQKGDVTKFLFHFAPQFTLMSISFEKIKWKYI